MIEERTVWSPRYTTDSDSSSRGMLSLSNLVYFFVFQNGNQKLTRVEELASKKGNITRLQRQKRSAGQAHIHTWLTR